MSREFTRETWLAELLEALKIVDMAMIKSFSEKGCLTIDRRAVRYVALTKDTRVSLRQML
jgi:hypothetical protein